MFGHVRNFVASNKPNAWEDFCCFNLNGFLKEVPLYDISVNPRQGHKIRNTKHSIASEKELRRE